MGRLNDKIEIVPMGDKPIGKKDDYESDPEEGSPEEESAEPLRESFNELADAFGVSEDNRDAAFEAMKGFCEQVAMSCVDSK